MRYIARVVVVLATISGNVGCGAHIQPPSQPVILRQVKADEAWQRDQIKPQDLPPGCPGAAATGESP